MSLPAQALTLSLHFHPMRSLKSLISVMGRQPRNSTHFTTMRKREHIAQYWLRVPDANALGDSCTVKFCSAVEPPLTADFYVDSTCVANGWALNLSDYSITSKEMCIHSWSWYLDGAQTPFATPGHTLPKYFPLVPIPSHCPFQAAPQVQPATSPRPLTFPLRPIADFAFVRFAQIPCDFHQPIFAGRGGR